MWDAISGISEYQPAMRVVPQNPPVQFAPPKVTRRTVFLLEDDPLITAELEETLEEFGWTVAYKANNVEDGLQIAQESVFHVAILDIKLGERESNAVAQALSKRRIPIIICTGYPSESLKGEYLAIRILEKPFSSERLREMLEEAWVRTN